MAQNTMKLGREDYKKKRELDELRKLGAAPAEVDAQGYIINPHIPQYMAEAPWYLSQGTPGLQHQRIMEKKTKYIPLNHEIKKGEIREIKNLKKFKKFKIGSCENCGATTHKKRDCTERPRKIGAKYTNVNIANDEYINNNNNNNDNNGRYRWDGKRDRWNNYNIANHQYIIERHEKIEKERRKKKAKELDKALLSNNNNDNNEDKKKKVKKYRKKKAKIKNNNNNNDNINDDNSDTDTDSDSDDSDIDSDDDLRDRGQVIQRFDSKKRQTVRNLRIREDLPKYLRNLDTDSAYYDPKTRSMRTNPYLGTDKELTELYKGDNFIKNTGIAMDFYQQNRFAGLSVKMNGELLSGTVHNEANPTLTEKVFKEHKKKKDNIKEQFTQKMIDRYGGKQHLKNIYDKNLKNIVFGSNETYVEYDQHGNIINGKEKYVEKSKYIEDELNGNHKYIWGSYYDIKNDKWGFKCCQNTQYNSYCTGNKGIKTKEMFNDKKIKKKKNIIIGVTMKPKDMINNDKLVNPSGYVSTRGILGKDVKLKNINSQNNKKKKKRKIPNNQVSNNAKKQKI